MCTDVSFIVLLEGGPACGRSLTEVGMAKVMQQPPKIVGPAGGVIVSCPGKALVHYFISFHMILCCLRFGFNNESLARYANVLWP